MKYEIHLHISANISLWLIMPLSKKIAYLHNFRNSFIPNYKPKPKQQAMSSTMNRGNSESQTNQTKIID